MPRPQPQPETLADAVSRYGTDSWTQQPDGSWRHEGGGTATALGQVFKASSPGWAKTPHFVYACTAVYWVEHMARRKR